MKAQVGDVVLAESSETKVVGGTHYFPRESVNKDRLEPTDNRRTTPEHGTAHFYDVVLDDDRLKDAAWYFPDPEGEASHIKDHVAFHDPVNITN